MATHEWMRRAGAPEVGANSPLVKTNTAAPERRTRLEFVLAAAGFIAWVWCAFEILGAVVH